jgi:hypothetical protein
MAIGTKIVFWTLLINISAGILGVGLSELYPNNNGGLPIGYSYSESEEVARTDWTGEISTPQADPSSGWFMKFLDFITIGYYTKIKTLIDNTLFGFPSLFKNIGILPEAYLGYFNGIMTLIYIVAIGEVFTAKRLT